MNGLRSERWRLALWALLLLPLVFVLPAVPIDETRYLTAAWEMHLTGEWLVPTVNFVWYTDKSPPLFWLINAVWTVTGVHVWAARLLALAIALGTVLYTRRLAWRLTGDGRLASTAAWLYAGLLTTLVYADAVMFDLPLTLCVLAVLDALLELDATRWRRGIVALGVALGAGLLVKGPVLLVDVAGVAVLGFWWSATARARPGYWFAAQGAGLLIGLAMLALWLVPAALHAGPSYWEPLLEKVSGRVVDSFAHARPLYWYVLLLPAVLLPWWPAVRVARDDWKHLAQTRTGRFALAWMALPFLFFSLISGKQPAYLLPLLPAAALAVATLLHETRARLALRALVPLLVLLASVLALTPWLLAKVWVALPTPSPWLALLALVPLLLAFLLWRRGTGWPLANVSLALSASVVATLLGVVLMLRPALDVVPAARVIADAQRAGIPVASLGSDHGMYGFTGRLRRPVERIPPEDALAWARRHPQGLLTTEWAPARLSQPAWRSFPYRLGGQIMFWRAAQLLASGPGAGHEVRPARAASD